LIEHLKIVNSYQTIARQINHRIRNISRILVTLAVQEPLLRPNSTGTLSAHGRRHQTGPFANARCR